MNEPYRILGVDPEAPMRTVRRAYRTLKRKYRPGCFGEKELNALAKERKRQIENAYREIRLLRAGRELPASSAPQPTSPMENVDFTLYERVRDLLARDLWGDAEKELKAAPISLRNAEWYFLMGQTLRKKSYFLDAQRMMEIACRIEPENAEYKSAYDALKTETKGYGGGYRLSTPGSGDFLECCGACCCEGCAEGCCEAGCEVICEGICSGF